MIFNSLGSNYNFGFSLKALFGGGGFLNQERLKKYLSNKYQGKAVLLYKGREAILLALKLLNLPKGSLVAINGYTCYAVYQPIAEIGLTPLYLDLPKTALNFSVQSLLEASEENPNLKVVIIQNTLGYPCEIEEIAEICKQKNLILIEDLAHSAGTFYKNGQQAGSVGDFVVLSFGQDKIIDAVSGGALIIRNQKYFDNSIEAAKVSLKQRLKDRFYPEFTWKIRTYYGIGVGKLQHKLLNALGWLSKPLGAKEKIVLHEQPGWYANLALNRFENLKTEIAHRRKLAEIYATSLDKKFLIPDAVEKINLSTNLRFPILVEKRAELINFLKANGLHLSDVWYDAPVAPKKYLEFSDYDAQCPQAEEFSARMLNLPTHINVSIKQAQKIASLINSWSH